MLKIHLVVLFVTGLILFYRDSIAEPVVKKDFLSVLSKGQKVILKETPDGYQIHVFNAGITEVVEVGPDYIVVEDLATTTRIPIYSIKAIVVTKKLR